VEVTSEAFARFFEVMSPLLDERQRRVLAGAAAAMLGRGGQARVAEATGMSRSTVIAGMKEVAGGPAPSGRVRAPGAGPKPRVDTQPGLLEALDELVHPETRGTPMSLLRWTSKSTAKLARDLVRQGFEVSDDTVGRILKRLGYSLQSPAKVKEGTTHPDRDGQFRYLHGLAQRFVADGEPVISVDTKKKELVGDFDNGGVEWQPEGEPERVNVHDFVDPELGRAIPYGIYDETNNEGWVAVGDTAEFAVNAIRSWWNHMGRTRFPDAAKLLITADASAPTATGSEPGNPSSPASPPRPASRSRCATTRRAPRSGTGSNTLSTAIWFSPLGAVGSSRARSREVPAGGRVVPRSGGWWCHSLSGGGVDAADAVAFGYEHVGVVQ
jgi:Rhodopirellula transposase DDE domain